MELEFDKEIDALLRQKDFAPASTGAVATDHLDADEIAAFAGNALPDAGRNIYIRHMASCERCRTLLSSVVELNSATEISAQTTEPVKDAAPLQPWYESLLRFPTVAYAMGGLIVIFAGFMTFSIVRNPGLQSDGEVSQVAEDTRPGLRGPNIGDETAFPPSTSNTAANSNASMSTANQAAANAGNLAVAVAVSPAEGTAVEKTMPRLTESTKETAAKNDFSRDVGGTAAPSASTITPPAPADQSKGRNLPEAERADQSLSLLKTESLPKSSAEARKDARRMKSLPTAPLSDSGRDMQSNSVNNNNLPVRRMVGGRSFNLRQGVWYDSTFQGQTTTNVRRGTEAYKNLDAGIRSIADNLSGTLVIVWKTKAYRIQ